MNFWVVEPGNQDTSLRRIICLLFRWIELKRFFFGVQINLSNKYLTKCFFSLSLSFAYSSVYIAVCLLWMQNVNQSFIETRKFYESIKLLFYNLHSFILSFIVVVVVHAAIKFDVCVYYKLKNTAESYCIHTYWFFFLSSLLLKIFMVF